VESEDALNQQLQTLHAAEAIYIQPIDDPRSVARLGLSSSGNSVKGQAP
jgi:hypothetical protein